MKKVPVFTSIYLITCLFLSEGCLFSQREELSSRPDGIAGSAEARLVLTPAALVRGDQRAPAILDSVHIRITGEDMAPIEFAFSGDSLACVLQNLPAGPVRVVTAELFRAGRLLYLGQGTFGFKRESRVQISLRCDPQFSRVTSQFHIPIGMPVPIADGMLHLLGKAGAYTAKLSKHGEFGSFTVDEIPGGVSYDVDLALADSSGKTRYEAKRTSVFLPLGEEAKWDLSLLPTEAQAGLALNLEPTKVTQFSVKFPSLKRSPQQWGEIVISEFYAAPSTADSGSEGEWFELFNRTGDSLSLAGCRMSRDHGGGVSRSLPLDSSLVLAPGQAMVFGRSAALADVHYLDFSLVNTSATLILLGNYDALPLDSVRYSSLNADSLALQQPIPIKEGMVTSLDADSLWKRASLQSWCLLKQKTRANTVGVYATPGSLESCLD